MKDTIHYCWLGGLALPYTAEFPQNVERFPSPDNGVTPTAIPPVCVSEKDWEFYHSQGIERKADMEFSVLAAHFSDSLLPFDRVIIHSVALRRQDKAYLICAASGTGKTTQARFLQQLHPGEFGIICGDRPVLEFREKEIVVHPSPWNGKEDLHGAEAAGLAGIILLERGDENRIVSVTEREAAFSLYPQFIQTSVEPQNIRRVVQLEIRALKAVPLWKLTTHEVPDSTKMLYEAVFYSNAESACCKKEGIV